MLIGGSWTLAFASALLAAFWSSPPMVWFSLQPASAAVAASMSSRGMRVMPPAFAILPLTVKGMFLHIVEAGHSFDERHASSGRQQRAANTDRAYGPGVRVPARPSGIDHHSLQP